MTLLIPPTFRATVWHCSSNTALDEGYRPTRYVTQFVSESETAFRAEILDRYLSDVDADVSIGPVTQKSDWGEFRHAGTPNRYRRGRR